MSEIYVSRSFSMAFPMFCFFPHKNFRTFAQGGAPVYPSLLAKWVLYEGSPGLIWTYGWTYGDVEP